jgi:hypothetical protein
VGLRVRRVDLLHGRVTVAEQVAEVNGRLIPGPPKTEAGRRTVTLPAAAAVALAEHLAAFAEPVLTGWSSRCPRAGICGGRTSVAAGGSLPRARPASRGCASTIYGTRPPPWRWRRGEHPGVDGAHGPHLAGGGASLPACDGRPGPGPSPSPWTSWSRPPPTFRRSVRPRSLMARTGARSQSVQAPRCSWRLTWVVVGGDDGTRTHDPLLAN